MQFQSVTDLYLLLNVFIKVISLIKLGTNMLFFNKGIKIQYGCQKEVQRLRLWKMLVHEYLKTKNI